MCMYVVTDAEGNELTELLDEYPTPAEQWQAWDVALLPDGDVPRGHYPRVQAVG